MKKIFMMFVLFILLITSLSMANEQKLKLSTGVGFPNMINGQVSYFIEKDVDIAGLFGVLMVPLGRQNCGANVNLGAYSIEVIAKKYFDSREGAFTSVQLGYRDFSVNSVQLDPSNTYDITTGTKSVYLGAGVGTNFSVFGLLMSAEMGVQYPFSNTDYETQNSGTGTLDDSIKNGPLKEGMGRMKGVLPYLTIAGSMVF